MPSKVITAEQMRQLEHFIIEKQHVPGLILMENAGRSVAELVAKHVKANGRVLVICGTGNNGGDGYVAARHLAMSGFFPIIWSIGDSKRISGNAKINFEVAGECNSSKT